MPVKNAEIEVEKAPESNIAPAVDNAPATAITTDSVSTAEEMTSGSKDQPRGSMQMENFNRIKEKVKKAIADKHTFMIHGRARIIREYLLARGWCEKTERRPDQIGKSPDIFKTFDFFCGCWYNMLAFNSNPSTSG